MFSTSDDHRDVELALRIGALDFITKPAHYVDIENVVKRFADLCSEPSEQKK
jgi:FixJ family two-component response regulator